MRIIKCNDRGLRPHRWHAHLEIRKLEYCKKSADIFVALQKVNSQRAGLVFRVKCVFAYSISHDSAHGFGDDRWSRAQLGASISARTTWKRILTSHHRWRCESTRASRLMTISLIVIMQMRILIVAMWVNLTFTITYLLVYQSIKQMRVRSKTSRFNGYIYRWRSYLESSRLRTYVPLGACAVWIPNAQTEVPFIFK